MLNNNNRQAMGEAAFRAYRIFNLQKRRCYYAKDARYSWYGARGIEVEYTAREFIGWWIANWHRTVNMRKPQVGRIDHDKNYALDNIEFQDQADNTREMVTRRDAVKLAGGIEALGPSKLRLVFSSIPEACRVTGAPRSLLTAHLAGTIESPIPQLVFRYTNAPVDPRAERKR